MSDKDYEAPNKGLSAEQKFALFGVKQAQSYEFKVKYAEIRAWEFYNECSKRGMNCYVSVGGLDSITLLLFLRKIGINVPAVSVSSLEDKSIQRVHKELGVENLKPVKSKVEVLREYGYPIISKQIAQEISYLQNPTDKNAHIRDTIFDGRYGQGQFSFKMPKKWLKKFGGADPRGAALGYAAAPFKVSDKCCKYLKELPCMRYERENNAAAFMGLMASEGGRREASLKLNGCNYFGKTRSRGCPFAIFMRQDLLQLALDLNVPVPEIYGEIVRDPDGTLRTTGAQRTGCSMCGFGIHLAGRPHTFDRLYKENPKEWHFWMIDQGWGEVLDYIGVEWRIQEKMNLDGNTEG